MGALIARGFSLIIDKLVGLASVMIAIAVASFTGYWLLGTDLIVWAFEQSLDMTIYVLNSVSLDLSFLNVGQYIPALPEDVVNMMGAIGIGQALGVIASAISIKVTLQLIPFTRLGK